MHQDQKIGLSLAVLVVGFAAAFCFRHQPLNDLRALAMEQATALDSRIEQLPVRAYTEREGIALSHREPDRIEPGSDLIDASYVNHPVPMLAPEPLQTGEVVELFAGPPEPVSSQTFLPAPVNNPPAEQNVDATPADSLETTPGEPPAESEPERVEKLEPPSDGVESERSDRPVRTYVVRSGDTLSGISLKYYGTTTRYLDIFQANSDLLRDPDDLPVGTTLRIP